jgi:hypothetical protein
VLIGLSVQPPKFCCGFRWWYTGTAPTIQQLDAIYLGKTKGMVNFVEIGHMSEYNPVLVHGNDGVEKSEFFIND